jgi:hypothetical protein
MSDSIAERGSVQNSYIDCYVVVGVQEDEAEEKKASSGLYSPRNPNF